LSSTEIIYLFSGVYVTYFLILLHLLELLRKHFTTVAAADITPVFIEVLCIFHA
jgi:hypothetical protein